jgi:hypothetical protein
MPQRRLILLRILKGSQGNLPEPHGPPPLLAQWLTVFLLHGGLF